MMLKIIITIAVFVPPLLIIAANMLRDHDSCKSGDDE